MEILTENKQIDLAYKFVQFTNKNIFLTGKAGTGKTTFLHNLKKNSLKRMIVVAPTGVAAINAGGVTIHSFFQLPFGPIIPGTASKAMHFSKEKINIIRGLELLVIDEISMVRADLLDGISDVLQKMRHNYLPFGGVQLLLIGDLHQLAPIAKEEEWELIKPFYDTIYFFSSKALKQSEYLAIELQHIYRQSDTTFINLLNKVRDNCLDHETLKQLNSRFLPDINNNIDDGSIYLTTHNYQSQAINQKKLNELTNKEHRFKAEVKGTFPEYAYPTDSELIVKKKAQVMFVKNDSLPEKRFFNGKIGTITKFDDDCIFVKCKGETEEIMASREVWQNLKYEINAQTGEITEIPIGTFTQYPLKLAWAITIHKSQGLTFEKAIIDARSAFAFGQVYVALSRCKTMEGLILSSKIDENSIKFDHQISSFTKQIEQNQPDNQNLNQAIKAYQISTLTDLFDFGMLEKLIINCHTLATEHKANINPEFWEQLNLIRNSLMLDINSVAQKFRIQIATFSAQNEIPEENELLQERIKKASVYFSENLNTKIKVPIEQANLQSDNKDIVKKISDLINTFYTDLYIKTKLLQVTTNGFNMHNYLEIKIKTILNAPQQLKKAVKQGPTDSKSKPSEILRKQLTDWRSEKAGDTNLEPYQILQQKVINEIIEKKPTTTKQLLQIKGLGNKKVRVFGNDIISIITTFCTDYNIPFNTEDLSIKMDDSDKNKVATTTITESYNLFKQGLSVNEIAENRGLVVSTIQGHLSEYLQTGEVQINQLIEPEKLMRIANFLKENPDAENIKFIKTNLDESIGYGDIKIALIYLNSNN